jgi:hypothetical protein
MQSARGSPATVLRMGDSDSTMKTNEAQMLLLNVEDKQKYEDTVTYVYAGNDPSAVHKPITVYKEKNTNAYLVAGRYTGFTGTHLKYKPLSEEERKVVLGKLGSNKIVRFLSNEKTVV